MNMLSPQADELREAARNIQGKLGRCLYRRKDVDEMQQVSGMLFKAADTIERLQAKLDKCEDRAEAFTLLTNGTVCVGSKQLVAKIDELQSRLNKVDLGGKSRYSKLFGTPERTAQTLVERLDVGVLEWCNDDCDNCPYDPNPYGCEQVLTLLEWLRGDA